MQLSLPPHLVDVPASEAPTAGAKAKLCDCAETASHDEPAPGCSPLPGIADISALALSNEQMKYESLREMLLFGLNMSRFVRLTSDYETAVRAEREAAKALKHFRRFRSGLILSASHHEELETLAWQLAGQLGLSKYIS